MRLGTFLIVLFVVLIPGFETWWEREVVAWADRELAGLETWHPPTVCQVHAADGTIVDEFALVRRIWVPLDELPDVAWQAVVAAEDRRFFEHHGVDWLGIARAMWVNLAAGRIREGGSTLTQQLVKNVVVGKERSYVRKLKEALLALRLEERLDKRRILELYVNYVFLGSGNYGLEAAAQDYFGKSARELDAGEAALLAGLIPAPSAYSPRRDPETAAERRRLVLDAMVDQGMVDVVIAQQAKKVPVAPPERDGGDDGTGTAYFTAVRREVRRLFGEQVPFEVGLSVHTPYDPKVQAAAERAIRDAAAAVEARQGLRGPQRRVDGEALRSFLAAAEGLPRDEAGEPQRPKAGACFPAAYVGGKQMMAGPFTLPVSDAGWNARVRNPDPEQPPRTFGQLARWGDVWAVCVDARGRVAPKAEPWVQGAAVVLDHATGGVVAMVGGRDMRLEGFNRATQARRQAGSSFKPYVYAAALERGRTQIDLLLDGPLALPGAGGRTWSPRNYDGGYAGLLPMRQAFARSLNTVAVRLGLETGPEAIARLAQAAGVRSRLRADLTLALGSSEVTVLDQAVGIATMVRGGVPVEPVYIVRLEDVTGAEVGRAGQRVQLAGLDVMLPGRPGARAMSPGTAWQMVEMMRAVVEEGTARRAWVRGRDRGGKTGTSSSYADAWFVGWTATHTIAVWIGQDDRSHLGPGETGGKAALPAWLAIVDALGEPEGGRLRPPKEVVTVAWNGRHVGLPAESVPQDLLRWSVPGPEPLPDFPGPAVRSCETTAALEGAGARVE